MSFDIVRDSLKYYDTNNEKYKNIMKKIKYVKNYTDDNDITRCLRLIFFDKNMNELFRSRAEIIGKYYKQYNIYQCQVLMTLEVIKGILQVSLVISAD